MRRTARLRGFTLVELLVTLALVAILMNVAAPSFVAFQRNAELTSLSNTLLASLNTARGEAMKRNRRAVVSPLNPTTWDNGWFVYVDEDSSCTYSAADGDILLQEQIALPSYIDVNANGTARTTLANPSIRYLSSGFPDFTNNAGLPNLTFTIQRNDVTNAVTNGQVRRLVIARTGRVRVCKPTSVTDANCLPG